MAETINLGIVGIKNMGEYDAETNYEKLNVVTYQGSSYCALKDTVGNLPTNTEYWQLYAQKGDTGGTGATGATGATGPQGPKGATGNPGGTPIPVDDAADMVDTTKIYVLTTDGHWYWYDTVNTQWTDGGTYQSTGISDKSIDIWKLDDDLQDLFIKEFSEQLESTLVENGFCYVSNSTFTINNSNTDFSYYYLDLDENDVYLFNVSNYQVVCGLLIVDTNDNNNIIYNSRPTSTVTDPEYKSVIIKANQANLRAYISYRKKVTNSNFATKYVNFARKLSNIELENSYDDTIEPLRITNNFIGFGSLQGPVSVSSFNDATFKIYPMEKGKIYEIKGFNFWSCKATVVDNNMEPLLISDNGTQMTAITPFTMKFKAEKDGYIFTNDFIVNNRNLLTTVRVIPAGINEANLEINNKLNGKKWVAMGDSLTDVVTLKPFSNYTNFVAERTGMNMSNYGVSGSGYMRGENNFVAVSQTIPTDTNIVTLFGSFNDLGTISDDADFGQLGDTTTDTLYGSIYTTIQNIIARCPNAKIGIIAPTCWGSVYYFNNSGSKARVDKYIKALEESAYYLGIPFLNLYKESNLRPWDADFRSLYYVSSGDSVHPNTAGHEKYIAPLVEEFIREKLSW